MLYVIWGFTDSRMKSKDYYYVFDKDDLTIEVVRGKDIYNALNNGI